MTRWKTATGAVALGLVLAAAASPGLAREHHSAQDWRNARAQATGADVGMSRAGAIHDCNSKTSSKKEYTWGNEQDQLYRSCMAQHGQPE